MDEPVLAKARPNLHLPLPPSPWASIGESLVSPEPMFFSAPSSPVELTLPPAQLVKQTSPSPISDEAFPSPTEFPIELALDDHGLTTLDKIYLFSQSKAVFHRVYIIHALPTFLPTVTPTEAVEYVLPILASLAQDDDEQVKAALVAELVTIIWWFFAHCQIQEQISSMAPTTLPPSIPVHAFTPILGTLLLSASPSVSGPARVAVVALLQLMSKTDQYEEGMHDVEPEMSPGLFGRHERALFEQEIIIELVIGLGRLDMPADMGEMDISVQPQDSDTDDDDDEVYFTPLSLPSPFGSSFSTPPALNDVARLENVNPYFPAISSYDMPSPSSMSLGSTSSSSSRSTPGSTNGSSASDSSTYSLSPSSQSVSSQVHIDNVDTKAARPHSKLSTEISSDILITIPLRIRPPHEQSHQDSLEPSSGSPVHRRPHDLFLRDLAESKPNSRALDSPLLRNTPSDPLPPPLPAAAKAQYAAMMSPLASPNPVLMPDGNGAADIAISIAAMPLVVGWPQDTVTTDVPGQESSPDGTAPVSTNTEEPLDDAEDGEYYGPEQAAIGRLSSMSLMAAVAASGCLNDDTKDVFLGEVGRVSEDPMYWVRREACYAIGALAKVLPEEAVTLTLLPLLQNMLTDSVHHVRQSSLYALPAILSRLPIRRRREVALSSLVPMSMDESASVRSGVLESLGEVIYTFHQQKNDGGASVVGEEEDEGGGPPPELLNMFLGRRIGGRSRVSIEDDSPMDLNVQDADTYLEKDEDKALDLFYADRSRPLICAFNFPAVALVLGRQRWNSELRGTYLALARNTSTSVRQTLAASLGALANIIGRDHAERDLVDVWFSSARGDEGEVRMKAAECLNAFLTVLGNEARRSVLDSVIARWKTGGWKGWRERECIAQSLTAILELDSAGPSDQKMLEQVGSLIRLVLLDAVNAVREAGIKALPAIWMTFSGRTKIFDSLSSDVLALAHSSTHRGRMTFVACQQSLILPGPESRCARVTDDEFWAPLVLLASDNIVGVRIGVARLVGLVCARRALEGKPILGILLGLTEQLSQDASQEVRSYIVTMPPATDLEAVPHPPRPAQRKSVDTFSRPPTTPDNFL